MANFDIDFEITDEFDDEFEMEFEDAEAPEVPSATPLEVRDAKGILGSSLQ